MNEIQQAMTVAAQRAGDAKQGTRTGIVEGYDPDTFSVKVRLQPSGVLTGWIPIATCWVGNGWGLAAAPTIGDAVQVDMAEGSIDAGRMTGSFFNDVDRAMGVPSGELWMRHKTGASIKFLGDGSIEITSPTALSTSAPVWNHVGPMSVQGAITVTGGDVTADGYGLKTHKHTGVRAGGETSGSATP